MSELAQKIAVTLGDHGLLKAVNKPKPVAMVEAAGVNVEDEDGWRKLTGDTNRDLNPMTHSRMMKLALYLWESNLLANRIIELPIAYMLAEGVNLSAGDEEVQAG